MNENKRKKEWMEKEILRPKPNEDKPFISPNVVRELKEAAEKATKNLSDAVKELSKMNVSELHPKAPIDKMIKNASDRGIYERIEKNPIGYITTLAVSEVTGGYYTEICRIDTSNTDNLFKPDGVIIKELVDAYGRTNVLPREIYLLAMHELLNIVQARPDIHGDEIRRVSELIYQADTKPMGEELTDLAPEGTEYDLVTYVNLKESDISQDQTVNDSLDDEEELYVPDNIYAKEMISFAKRNLEKSFSLISRNSGIDADFIVHGKNAVVKQLVDYCKSSDNTRKIVDDMWQICDGDSDLFALRVRTIHQFLENEYKIGMSTVFIETLISEKINEPEAEESQKSDEESDQLVIFEEDKYYIKEIVYDAFIKMRLDVPIYNYPELYFEEYSKLPAVEILEKLDIILKDSSSTKERNKFIGALVTGIPYKERNLYDICILGIQDWLINNKCWLNIDWNKPGMYDFLYARDVSFYNPVELNRKHMGSKEFTRRIIYSLAFRALIGIKGHWGIKIYNESIKGYRDLLYRYIQDQFIGGLMDIGYITRVLVEPGYMCTMVKDALLYGHPTNGISKIIKVLAITELNRFTFFNMGYPYSTSTDLSISDIFDPVLRVRNVLYITRMGLDDRLTNLGRDTNYLEESVNYKISSNRIDHYIDKYFPTEDLGDSFNETTRDIIDNICQCDNIPSLKQYMLSYYGNIKDILINDDSSSNLSMVYYHTLKLSDNDMFDKSPTRLSGNIADIIDKDIPVSECRLSDLSFASSYKDINACNKFILDAVFSAYKHKSNIIKSTINPTIMMHCILSYPGYSVPEEPRSMKGYPSSVLKDEFMDAILDAGLPKNFYKIAARELGIDDSSINYNRNYMQKNPEKYMQYIIIMALLHNKKSVLNIWSSDFIKSNFGIDVEKGLYKKKATEIKKMLRNEKRFNEFASFGCRIPGNIIPEKVFAYATLYAERRGFPKIWETDED